MWDPEKNYVYVSRDVLWLKRICFDNASLLPNEPIRNIEIPHYGAGKNNNDNDVTADASNAVSTEQNESPTLNNPSELKVIIGGEEIIPEDENEEDEWEMPHVEQTFTKVKQSRTGRTIHPIKHYHEEHQGVCTDHSTNYYGVLEDDHDSDEEMYQSNIVTKILGVGASVGGGFKHSSELKAFNYK